MRVPLGLAESTKFLGSFVRVSAAFFALPYLTFSLQLPGFAQPAAVVFVHPTSFTASV
jgi:hypothetical protein